MHRLLTIYRREPVWTCLFQIAAIAAGIYVIWTATVSIALCDQLRAVGSSCF